MAMERRSQTLWETKPPDAPLPESLCTANPLCTVVTMAWRQWCKCIGPKGILHWRLALPRTNTIQKCGTLWMKPLFPGFSRPRQLGAMIPTLELLGSLILIAFILKICEHHQLAVKIPIIADNQGNVFSMLNNKTRQMPTAAVLMQLVLTLHRGGGGAQLAPSHVKRDLNQWADDLTHPNPLGFNPNYHLDAKTVLSEFTLMNWALKEIYHYWDFPFSIWDTHRSLLDARCPSALQAQYGKFANATQCAPGEVLEQRGLIDRDV